MANYPRLSAMGVARPEEINHFSVNSIDYVDHLRIVYDRPDNSLLPVSRTYRFPRSQKSGGGSGDVMESRMEFREAIAELEALLASKNDKRVIADELSDELRQLQEDFAIHSENLNKLIGKVREI